LTLSLINGSKQICMKQVHIMAGAPFFAGVHILICIACYHTAPAQHQLTLPENCAIADSCQKAGQNVRILFWNVENLFDYRDDTLTADEEFTSGGAMHWTYTKLQTKLAHVAKTLLAAGEWNPPAIIGMCEVENRHVLNKLIYNSPLKSFNYRMIHRDSPDLRGIDVAILYRSDVFTPLTTEWNIIRFPFDTTVKTREILYAKGLLLNRDTIHIFVNHWPSRRGGEAASAPRRNYVASVLKEKVDSINQSAAGSGQLAESSPQLAVSSMQFAVCSLEDTMAPRHHPYIIIMGDFNDEPENESLCSILKARLDTNDLQPGDLVNMMHLMASKEGSHKFREHWGLLDQFIVSGSLLDKQHPLQVSPNSLQIFKPAFLLEDDLKYLDKKPKRTFLGPRYKGGFSDHLPIVMDVLVRGEGKDD